MINPVGNKVSVLPQHEQEVPHEATIYRVRKKIPTAGHIVEISEDLDEFYKKQVKVGDRVLFFNNHRLEEGELFFLDIDNLVAVAGEEVRIFIKET
jgi:co-chaperonin GroES (HSP10)